MFDLISIGDATIDTFIQIHDAEVKCNLDKTECLICVEYGSKIAVDKLTHIVAGNAANNAVGGQRLNLKTAIYVNVGDDNSGKQIEGKLKEEGVDTRYVISHKRMESNYSAILSFKGERTIFVYHQLWEYNLPDLERTRWVYFTSLSKSFTQSNLVGQLTQYLTRTGSKLFYNPGTYQIEEGIKKDPQLLALTELFIVNKEEAKKILGDLEIKDLLKEFVDLGPKMVIITNGPEGSWGYDGEKYCQLGIFPAKLMEMTGAGDSYAIGVLAGLSYGCDLSEAMRWGAANSASVIEKIGSQEGLLNFDEMQQKLKANLEILTKQI